MQSSFFLTLPSNSSVKWFKDNKPQNYKVQLPQPLELEGKWEAALVEIQYPKTWLNMDEDSGASILIEREDTEGVLKGEPLDEMHTRLYQAEEGSKFFELELLYDIKLEERKIKSLTAPNSIDLIHVKFPRGHYKSAQQLAAFLVDQVNKTYVEELKPIDQVKNKKLLRFEYDEIRNQISFQSDYHLATLIFYRDELPRMLGIRMPIHGYNYHKFPLLLEVKAVNEPVLTKSLSLYVYCDFVAHQVVGDTLAPILRAVPIRGEIGAETFIRPYYVPVTKGYISTVEIKIYGDLGNEIQFQSGTVILILHLRKCGIGN